MASTGISGFSGIDTQSLVQALMSIENQKLTTAQTKRAKMLTVDTAWSGIVTKLNSFNTSAIDLLTPSRFLPTTATSSDTTKVTVAGTPSVGTFSFGVSQLAASSLSTVSGFSSTTADVGAGTVGVNTGLSALGLSGVSGLVAGDHTVTISQASSRAANTSAAIAAPVNITTTNRSLTLAITTASGTVNKTLTLTTGTYANADALVTEINNRIAASAGTTAVAKNVGGQIVIENTAGEGSDYGLTTTGSFATTVGFDNAAHAGSDAVIDVDGTTTTITDVTANATLAVGTPSGPASVTVGSSGHLASGAATSKVYSFAAGTTLDQVAATLNGTGSTVTASVVGTTGSAQLLVSAKASGASASTSVSWSGFTVGTASQLRDGQDAKITLGSQTISRSTNTISDLIPGGTITLLGTTTSDVTITGSKDTAAAIKKVKDFVTSLNTALTTIDAATKTSPSDLTKAGPLVGDSTARSLRLSLVAAMQSQLPSGTYRSLAEIGVQIGRDGQFSVNETTLKKALDTDPDAVTAVVSRSVSATDSRVKLTSAQSSTVNGAYAVNITQAASRATAVGNSFASLASTETLTVTSGALSASFTAVAGSTSQAVADGLNAAFKSAGLNLVADLTSTGALRVASVSYGAAQSLSITSSGGTGTGLGGLTASGTNVAGTIDGVAATGNGQTLTSNSGNSKGLSLSITATAADVAGAGGNLSLGTATYNGGVASMLRQAIDNATGGSGSITTLQKSRAAMLRRMDDDIDRITRQLAVTEARLNKTYSALEAAMKKMNGSVPNWSSLSSS